MRIIPEDIEQQIVKKIRRGDTTAMKMMYDYLSEYLYGICSRYIDNDDDAKDVLQNAMVKILSNLDSFKWKGLGSLQAWSTKVAVNEALYFLRSRKRSNLVPLEEDIGESPDPDVSRIPQKTILEMIRKLPAQYRTVFNLYVFEDKSHREIAEILGIKESTSASNLHRAKKLLSEMILKYQKDHE